MGPAYPREYQFSLRSILLLITLLGCGLALGVSFAILAVAIYVTYQNLAAGRVWMAGAVVFTMLILTLFGVGVLVQIRLDTGDERLVVWGIPVSVLRMRDESRKALLSISDPSSQPRWCWCARSVASNHPDMMVRRMYKSAALWVKADPAVAGAIVRDLAEYLKSTHGMQGLPESSLLLDPPVLVWENGTERIPDDWRSDPFVREYLQKKGIAVAPEPEK